jgi:hypothetical protein
VTADKKYLSYAESLVRRCVHPDEDVGALNLLDVEKHWSYTVFLASLAKYLDVKTAADQVDRMYAYGQTTLVAYARWMLQQERPYFDQVEKLEYPTEAWAAQAFRKANVMRRAAWHTDEPLRSKLFDRGDELAERAWSDLLRFETRTSARSLAIVMVEGLWDCTLRRRDGDAPRAGRIDDFGVWQPFVPQRARVMQRMRSARGLAELPTRLGNPARWARYWQVRGASRRGS